MIYWLCRTLVKGLTSLFYRHKVYGQEHLTSEGGIVAGNHCSFLDPQLIGTSTQEEIHFLARDTLFKFPPFGWLLNKLNTHPVKRGKGNMHAFKLTIELIKEGKKVVLFPEGTRSKDGRMQKGQLGVGMLVMRADCVVFPAYVHGTYEVWNAHQRLPKLWGKTATIFGSPLRFDLDKDRDKKAQQNEIVEKIMEKLHELQTWYVNGAKGSPP